MTKELFVSSSPHETKVGMVEDDQLAEIYLERENEYTLAGSIYKGRVTRVLPGMQSAFVDIGLERDAFLYVSDFMELSEHDDDLDEVIPTPRQFQDHQAHEQSSQQAGVGGGAAAAPAMAVDQEVQIENQDLRSRIPAAEGLSIGTNPSETQSAEQDKDQRGGWRGRRRRGRGGRHNMPESRFARPSESSTPSRGSDTRSSENRNSPSRTSEPGGSETRSHQGRSPEYGPPPGYQPIILPGESISKYQRLQQRQRPATHAGQSTDTTQDSTASPANAGSFPEDEPLFAKNEAEPLHEEHDPHIRVEQQQQEHHQAEYGREQERLERMNVASIFGGDAAETGDSEPEEEVVEKEEMQAGHPLHDVSEHQPTSYTGATGTVAEEEIEEEEADLGNYAEQLEEDGAFEELEEETSAAEDYREPIAAPALATSAQLQHVTPLETFPHEAEEPASEEEDSEELEIEEAQAEAEALLDAEAGGSANLEARAEVRAPAGTAGYTQRAPRPTFDPRRQRGRRGGRRLRRQDSRPTPLITDLLKEGQEILVQIAKEPIGKKGARITSHIALPGRFLVYMPTVNHTGVSRKISSEDERQRLKRLVLSERENGHGGFIVRTAAQGASEDELRADIRFLKNLWSEIKSRAESGKSPALIYHDLNVVERVLRDQVTSDFSAIWVDNEQEYERILRFANRFQPALVRRVKLYTKETPLFEQFGLTEEINKALKSKVWLKSGGYIVINQTEALVAIDINTGKFVGKTARLEDTIVKTNVDAIKEIVRQIRLRDLGGIIVIDFIDMDERRNRQKVMQALEEALRHDRAPSKVLQFNDFGLVAITRKRVKQSLERTIGSPCPYCESTGFVKSVTTVCDEIYMEMRKLAKHFEHSDVMLRVNPEVAKVLKANNGRWLNEMEELIKKTIIVKSDPALHQEKFDIN
jgi:Rne/Rng family ribonuclease